MIMYSYSLNYYIIFVINIYKYYLENYIKITISNVRLITQIYLIFVHIKYFQRTGLIFKFKL